MIKIKSKLSYRELEHEIDRLPIKQKARLVRRLMKATWEARFDNLRERIWKRAKKYPISSKDIIRAVREVRQGYSTQHAKNCH